MPNAPRHPEELRPDEESRQASTEAQRSGPLPADQLATEEGWLAGPQVDRLEGAVASEDGRAPDGPGLALPSSIGPYRILDVLGEGGMGVVYRAEQTEPVERNVALKVVRASLTSPNASARFAAERQALARLSHPNVAQIFEAGRTDEGFPYFAMELVQGETISDYCDAKRLTVRARLELFMTVCRGVQHAHQKGIIHRDLKPSNILVTEIEGRPVPKIIDFGIAKALDRPLTDVTQLTGHGLIGTPAYMSPEALQPAGEGSAVDTRTDVYALGILLYELLAGTRPFEAPDAGFAEMLRAISEDEAPRPSIRLRSLETETVSGIAERRHLTATTLVRRLERDLDWIVMKAIAKRPEERYDSAAELVTEVERHLLDLPVLAKPPSVAYRFRKLVRRHRVATVASLLVLASLILGIAGTSIGLARAKRETAKTREALQDAEDVTDFIVGLFDVSNPRLGKGEAVSARQILEEGARTIEEKLADQPLRRARLLQAIGQALYNLNLYPDSEQMLAEALTIRERELPANDKEIAATLYAIARLEDARLDTDAAERAARRALAIYESAPEPDHQAIASTLRALAIALWRSGKLEEAEAVMRRSLEEQRQTPEPSSLVTADLWETLGNVLHERGQYAEAVPAFEKSLALREHELGSSDIRIAASLLNLSIAYRGLGRTSEALELQTRAVRLFEESLPDSRNLAIALNNLGIDYRDLGRYAEAEPLFRRSLSIMEKSLGPTNPWVGNPLTDLGVLYWKIGRLDEAEKLLQRALKLWEKNPGEKHPWTAWPLWALGNVYRDEGRLAEAEPYYQRAVAIRRAALPADDPDLRDALNDYAKLLRAMGREDETAALPAPSHPSDPN